MTAFCSGGTSSAVGGAGLVINVTAAAISAIVSRFGGKYSVPFLAGLGGLTYELDTICATDPPSDPGMTGDDFLHLLNPILDPFAFKAAADKAIQLIGRYVWFSYCKCDSGTTPAAPAFPAQPSGTPITAIGTECFSWQESLGPWPIATSALPVHWPDASNYHHPVAGSSSVVLDLQHNPAATGTHQDLTIFFITCQTEPCFVGDNTRVTLNLPIGQHVFWSPPVTPADVKWAISAAPTSSSITNDTVTVTFREYCLGQAPAPPTNCCPTDPQLLAQLQLMQQQLTLIQRQAAPFAYVYGANHAGLSGHGSIAVSGLLGLSVDVTTLPASYGSADGSPVQLFDLGFVTLGTADGYEMSRPIDHDGTLVMPQAAGVFTSFGYSLSPGVVVAVRELIREP